LRSAVFFVNLRPLRPTGNRHAHHLPMKPELASAVCELPATCEIRDWPVFVHGFYKDDLYPPADLERMEANFRLLSADGAAITGEDGGPFLTANVKLGHDKQQRAKKNLGFINLGQVCRLERG
jgi:hypothetical protein